MCSVNTGKNKGKETTLAENKNGKITQVIGAVLDVKFEQDCLPDINEALKIPTRSGGTLVVEVAQHLGDDIVR